MTAHNPLFSALFLSQVLLISLLIPHWIKTKAQHVMHSRPESDYPKLYPLGQNTIHTTLKRFQNQHLIIMLMGLAMLIHAHMTQASELLHWDNQAVLTLLFMAQQLPYITLGLFWHRHHQMMRDLNQNPVRTASLQPRRFSDFVPPALVVLALLMIGVHTATVLYAQQHPFPGFVGLWNLVFVLMMNVFFGLGIYVTINARKSDPHLADGDRLMQQSITAKLLVLSSIAASLFLSISILLSVFELKAYENVAQMIYFQIIALLSFVTLTTAPVDYSVYAQTPTDSIQGANS